LESLQKAVFSFASRGGLAYFNEHPVWRALLHPMIVCSCNVLTDHDVRNAVSVAQLPPRTPGQIYGCLGCSAQCGRCARTIKKIMDEALGACAKSCCSGCPHTRADAEPDAVAEFALAAS
jgi:bacterioferritin-associated ferredoxin